MTNVLSTIDRSDQVNSPINATGTNSQTNGSVMAFCYKKAMDASGTRVALGLQAIDITMSY
ncbi:hypothetical protein [Pseudomonas sp. RL_15y_Pfl2_60]|uniref:hypothetical protein n=1 Tax=Pseudomonas sp. RL_15y_Pfl2_60 TaxID=3088709 RepID=UPI0030DD52DC